ncbi:glycerophosphodiester phosphodiesterase [Streptococcus oriscaviae]|uniref:GP-PDE domain-containing protein n=1 Tax=Streptococcus oriscaviae TaxID=2781599 RepID=A0ABX7YJP6_9STRE|nr:glycerophosphodiester phosphodiesterase family protein [Streptococcus oriscaviae]QUE53579.1 hypothetical protein INT76_06865 [Streptococcus oriscaviae]
MGKRIIGCLLLVVAIAGLFIRHTMLSTMTTLKKEQEKFQQQLTTTQDDIQALAGEISKENQTIADLTTQESRLIEEKTSLEGKILYPVMVSHRGYNDIAPEESEISYKKAVEDGFTHLEGDIHLTLDGVAVLHHDETINRIARNPDGSRLARTLKISEHTYEELRQYDYGIYKGAEYRGTELLTFDRFIALAKELGVEMLHVELKQDLNADQKKALYEITQKYGMAEKTGWATFYWEEFADFDLFAPEAQLEVLAGTFRPNLIETLQALSNGKRKIIASVGPGVSADNIVSITAAGFDVYVWTVDKASDLAYYGNLAIKAVITNKSSSLEDLLKAEPRARMQVVTSELQQVTTSRSTAQATVYTLQVKQFKQNKRADDFKDKIATRKADIKQMKQHIQVILWASGAGAALGLLLFSLSFLKKKEKANEESVS